MGSFLEVFFKFRLKVTPELLWTFVELSKFEKKNLKYCFGLFNLIPSVCFFAGKLRTKLFPFVKTSINIIQKFVQSFDFEKSKST